MTKQIIINEETDFTLSGLRDYLNVTFKTKTTKKPFTMQDVQQYEMRGYLPAEYGGHTIEIIKSESVGIKVLRLIGLKKQS